MNTRRTPVTKARQRGWSLIESAMVVILMGAMGTGLWKTLDGLQKKEEVVASRTLLQRAEDSIYGMALRDLRLPWPTQYSVTGDGYAKGVLPNDLLITEATDNFSYEIKFRLGMTRSDLSYKADPMGLLVGEGGDRLLPQRRVANELDLCYMIAEQDGLYANRLRPESNKAFQLVENGSAERVVSYRDMFHRLRCIPTFARLTTEVKSAALFNDLQTLARINADLRGVELQATRDFLRSHAWRRDVVITNITVSSLKMAAGLISFQITPAAALLGVPILAAQAMGMTLWVQLLELSEKAVKSNSEAIPSVQARHEEAKAYADQLALQRDRHLQAANSIQNSRGQQP